jgi:hypothetical protein
VSVKRQSHGTLRRVVSYKLTTALMMKTHLKRRPTSTRLHGATSQEAAALIVVCTEHVLKHCHFLVGSVLPRQGQRVRDEVPLLALRAQTPVHSQEVPECDKPPGRLKVLRLAVCQTLTDGWDELTASIIRTQHKSVHQSARLQLIQKAGHWPRQRAGWQSERQLALTGPFTSCIWKYTVFKVSVKNPTDLLNCPLITFTPWMQPTSQPLLRAGKLEQSTPPPTPQSTFTLLFKYGWLSKCFLNLEFSLKCTKRVPYLRKNEAGWKYDQYWINIAFTGLVSKVLTGSAGHAVCTPAHIRICQWEVGYIKTMSLEVDLATKQFSDRLPELQNTMMMMTAIGEQLGLQPFEHWDHGPKSRSRHASVPVLCW